MEKKNVWRAKHTQSDKKLFLHYNIFLNKSVMTQITNYLNGTKKTIRTCNN